MHSYSSLTRCHPTSEASSPQELKPSDTLTPYRSFFCWYKFLISSLTFSCINRNSLEASAAQSPVAFSRDSTILRRSSLSLLLSISEISFVNIEMCWCTTCTTSGILGDADGDIMIKLKERSFLLR